jgi:hypothetical protein
MWDVVVTTAGEFLVDELGAKYDGEETVVLVHNPCSCVV